jgi:hypothetical protein
MPFWPECDTASFFHSFPFTTFINDSHKLTVPISLALFRMKLPDSRPTSRQYLRFGALSLELHTPPLPATHVKLGYFSRKRRFFSSSVANRHPGTSNNYTSDFESHCR